MEVVSGIILGLDTDTPETGGKLLDFIEKSHIPLLTINLLQALPQTPLWDRLQRENRLHSDEEELESNVAFHLPYETVLGMWRECMAKAYNPKTLFERYEYQAHATYVNRIKRPLSKQRLSRANLKKFIAVGLVAHHLIMFARDATSGRGNASHYSAKTRVLDLDAPAKA
jgi:radical SAM superfamily enzyme YgiQ (UPF0313 family)